jgi:hypothetical protein
MQKGELAITPKLFSLFLQKSNTSLLQLRNRLLKPRCLKKISVAILLLKKLLQIFFYSCQDVNKITNTELN